ncbi:hypothetical protein Oweho_2876 [Owenweeksia hongkongensis DSM 17368]|uniref:Uncharacterized protein n=1 Tax=Owenweeksia hongkongensis (strain DSM 17368 / CIP 108786 / JCM 12287 / NRRL B-23963 / UST20020801) TaxID=926562 RepID=G8R0V7_OWEHD|nr:hypothetical protein [Owenweeksia hongkongensis]AEV33834.1 hypothetical protein Oweho_2876 [Owenweeksia hongkongensis DSM 17368]
MFRAFLYLFLILLTISCKDETSSKHEHEKQNDKKESAIDDFATKHNALQHWDTVNYDFSLQYQELFTDSPQPLMIDDSRIIDVYRKDSTYFIFGEALDYPFFYFRLEIERGQAKKIIDSNIKPYDNKIAIVTMPTSIRQLDFILNAEFFDEHQYRIVLDGGGDFFLEGKMIDFLLLQK